MAGKLDEISRAIGALETSVRDLKRRMDENLKLQASRHADNATALRELAAKLDQHAAAVRDDQADGGFARTIPLETGDLGFSRDRRSDGARVDRRGRRQVVPILGAVAFSVE